MSVESVLLSVMPTNTLHLIYLIVGAFIMKLFSDFADRRKHDVKIGETSLAITNSIYEKAAAISSDTTKHLLSTVETLTRQLHELENRVNILEKENMELKLENASLRFQKQG